MGGSFFLLYKGTREIHHRLEGDVAVRRPLLFQAPGPLGRGHFPKQLGSNHSELATRLAGLRVGALWELGDPACRELARQSPLPDIQGDLLELAARFERMAAYYEAQRRLGSARDKKLG